MKLPVEVHLYARGAHGFGMGTRSKFASIKTWTQRMSDWLADSGFLMTAEEKAKAQAAEKAQAPAKEKPKAAK